MMRILGWLRAVLIGTLCVVLFNAHASDPGTEALQNMPERGSVAWKDWVFDYHIGNTNMEGLTITNVSYKARKVLAQASLPVVRVKYKGDASKIGSGCGPFMDKFFSFNLLGLLTDAWSTGTIRPFPGKPALSKVVRLATRASDGTETLGLYVYAEIGGYLLWHGWNLSTDGRIDPVLYSSGWSCSDGLVKNDHRHHPYWRIIFRIDDGDNDLWVLRAPASQKPIARKVTEEADLSRQEGEELAFIVSSKSSARHALVRFPTAVNGQIDRPGPPWFGFSNKDAAVRKYKSHEDRGWDFGAKDELAYGTPKESIGSGFNVLWLTSHMGHAYVPGKDDEKNIGWHWTGPSIQLVNWE